MLDTARIHALVRRGRRRLRMQSALEGAVLAAVAASAIALILVYLVRRGVVPDGGTGALIVGAAALLVIGFGALVGALRSIPTEVIATRIDRASGLADRLANACAFEITLASPGAPAADTDADETRVMMRAAIADALRHVGSANVKAATPFRWPRDTRAAVAFTVVAGVVAGFYFEPPPEDPMIARIKPPKAPRKSTVDLVGERLCGPDPVLHEDGRCGGPLEVHVGPVANGVVAEVVNATPETLVVRIPDTAPIGLSFMVVRAEGRRSWPRPFEVLADGDRRYQPAERVALAEDDLAFSRDLLQDLKQTAAEMQDPELKEFADKVEALLDQADKGELTKEQLLDKLAEAEKAYADGAKPEEVERAIAELEKTGKELKKENLTRPIGEALEQGDLARAQEEMKKLADKLDKGELSEKERAQAARAMDKAAEAFEKREQADRSAEDKKIARAEAEQKKAEQKRDDAKTEADKERLGKEADERRRKVEEMKQQKEERQASEQKRTLKRLHRNMKKAAEEMQKDQDKQENRKQASRAMEDMARDTGKVDGDKRKMASQKKSQSQLDDLREAMRRAKKGGSRGAKDRFGRNKRNQDFDKRARGGKGSKGAWQRGGQGKGQGQGQQPGGQGKQPGGDSYGDGEGPDMMGDATARQGNTKDESLQGVHGKGASTRETILSAAQKGFSSQSYRQVYGKYKAKVEEVINAEKVPSGYKFYVRKYFQKIKPHAM